MGVNRQSSHECVRVRMEDEVSIFSSVHLLTTFARLPSVLFLRLLWILCFSLRFQLLLFFFKLRKKELPPPLLSSCLSCWFICLFTVFHMYSLPCKFSLRSEWTTLTWLSKHTSESMKCSVTLWTSVMAGAVILVPGYCKTRQTKNIRTHIALQYKSEKFYRWCLLHVLHGGLCDTVQRAPHPQVCTEFTVRVQTRNEFKSDWKVRHFFKT